MIQRWTRSGLWPKSPESSSMAHIIEQRLNTYSYLFNEWTHKWMNVNPLALFVVSWKCSMAMILMDPQTAAACSQAPSNLTSQICESNHSSSLSDNRAHTELGFLRCLVAQTSHFAVHRALYYYVSCVVTSSCYWLPCLLKPTPLSFLFSQKKISSLRAKTVYAVKG